MGRAAIIGTAGHIDHGKTALIRALTGQDTDRLKEEKERGISIDLGFAYLQLDDGRRLGIVDVPGHERFIRNMLAGAHGIDLVLFTVAADDGVMPQTQEHLDILHCLGVRAGVFVITKSDLVDAGRLAEVREEIEILALDTSLEGVPIVAVSSVTGAGLDDLRREIARQLEGGERPAPGGHYFRLPVDRVFVMRGHGVVVTGTAIAGRVAEGQAVRVLPAGASARVRGIQVHGASVASAGGGERVALNLGGVDSAEICRGQVVCDPRLRRATDRFDALVEIRPGARWPVRSHRRLRVHLGTADVLGRAVILDGRVRLDPRASGYCQFVLEDPVVALRGDRFIIRDETARWTLGGGEVVNPFARRHAREEVDVGARLEHLRTAPVPVAVETWVSMSEALVVAVEEIATGLDLREEDVRGAIAGNPALRGLPEGTPEACTARWRWEAARHALAAAIDGVHGQNPLARGAEVEALRARVCGGMAVKYFRALVDDLASTGEFVREESWVRRATHRVALTERDREVAERAVAVIEAGGITPPDLAQVAVRLGASAERLAELLAVVEGEGRLVRVAPDLFYGPAPFAAARELLLRRLDEAGEISAGVFRDLLGASRRYSIALLDYFDRTGVTLRVGDVRRLRPRN